MRSILVIVSLVALAVVCSDASVIVRKPLKCEFYQKKGCDEGDDRCNSTIEVCDDTDPDKPYHCFVLWQLANITDETSWTLELKGCFSYNVMCNRSECINNDAELKKNLSFCCCNEDMCNKNHRWIPIPVKTPEKVALEVEKEIPSSPTVTIIVVMIGLAIFFLVVWVGLVMSHRFKKAQFNEVMTIETEAAGSLECLTNYPIELLCTIARGRFGTVWRGTMKSDEVAVKVFPMQDKQSWLTEQDIFKLPRMRHPNILEFIGVEKHTEMIPPVFWLITAYHSHGSLCDYLKAHTVTWVEMCKIAESMARGLMHLHEEVPANKTEPLKPAIAHRDFKSKNVLLKHDLTACIADFGLALVFQPGKPCGDTHGQVGTRRYMAPEVLEGAINFTPDAFLRIDVYACGLVLWELVSRCSSYGCNVPEYTLPFEDELGSHPTLDEMQENVVMKKIRPRISNQWRTHPSLNSLCDTMEECWDHDAEARLSASCIMERVSQLARHHPPTSLLIENNNNNVNSSTLIANNTTNTLIGEPND